jgi:hypothetical protein
MAERHGRRRGRSSSKGSRVRQGRRRSGRRMAAWRGRGRLIMVVMMVATEVDAAHLHLPFHPRDCQHGTRRACGARAPAHLHQQREPDPRRNGPTQWAAATQGRQSACYAHQVAQREMAEEINPAPRTSTVTRGPTPRPRPLPFAQLAICKAVQPRAGCHSAPSALWVSPQRCKCGTMCKCKTVELCVHVLEYVLQSRDRGTGTRVRVYSEDSSPAACGRCMSASSAVSVG